MVSELRVSEKKTFSFLFPLSEHFLVVAKGPKMMSSMFSRSEIQKKKKHLSKTFNSEHLAPDSRWSIRDLKKTFFAKNYDF